MPIALKPDHVHDAGVIDPKTRALPLQIEVENRARPAAHRPDRNRRPVHAAARERMPAVPREAVLMEAGRPYVFVQVGGERFARRFVDVAVARRRSRWHAQPASSQVNAW